MKIHPTALVESDEIGAGTCIWAYAHILKGAKVGENVNVSDHVFIEGGASVGDNVTIKNGVMIWEGILIEDDVFVGPGVVFTNDERPRSPRMPEARARYATREPWLLSTIVRRGCSIGAAAVICPGIELGAYAMVAAGAVVTRSIPPFSLVAGNAAKKLGDICSCGQRLLGSYEQTTCKLCGETGIQRRARISATIK